MDQSKGGHITGENEIQLSTEDVVRVGGELKRLIRTQSFETAIEVMREEYRLEVFSSAPHERDRREAAYYRARALEDLIATMNTFVAYHEEDAMRSLGDEDQL